ncbi:MAG: hypothetical protein GX221_00120 [Candidatus Riflebacteria bacterium]|nr:hypothetical protein [Candidatus Riflebacteria bacterium]
MYKYSFFSDFYLERRQKYLKERTDIPADCNQALSFRKRPQVWWEYFWHN